jgi:hypothetical protein
MTMWPISTRVNKPDNDDPSILDRTADPQIGKLPWIGLIVHLETNSRGQAGDDGGSSMTQV